MYRWKGAWVKGCEGAQVKGHEGTLVKEYSSGKGARAHRWKGTQVKGCTGEKTQRHRWKALGWNGMRALKWKGVRVHMWKSAQVKGQESTWVKGCKGTQEKGHEGTQVKGHKGTQAKGQEGTWVKGHLGERARGYTGERAPANEPPGETFTAWYFKYSFSHDFRHPPQLCSILKRSCQPSKLRSSHPKVAFSPPWKVQLCQRPSIFRSTQRRRFVYLVMARAGTGLETMGYYIIILCRSVHTTLGPGMGPDLRCLLLCQSHSLYLSRSHAVWMCLYFCFIFFDHLYCSVVNYSCEFIHINERGLHLCNRKVAIAPTGNVEVLDGTFRKPTNTDVGEEWIIVSGNTISVVLGVGGLERVQPFPCFRPRIQEQHTYLRQLMMLMYRQLLV